MQVSAVPMLFIKRLLCRRELQAILAMNARYNYHKIVSRAGRQWANVQVFDSGHLSRLYLDSINAPCQHRARSVHLSFKAPLRETT